MTITPAPDTLDLDAIQARVDKATPGPWRSNEPLKGWIEAPNCCDRGPMHIADIRGWGHLTGRGHGAHAMDEASAIAVHEANADFIKHAREDVPALVAEIRRLRSATTPSMRERCARVADERVRVWRKGPDSDGYSNECVASICENIAAAIRALDAGDGGVTLSILSRPDIVESVRLAKIACSGGNPTEASITIVALHDAMIASPPPDPAQGEVERLTTLLRASESLKTGYIEEVERLREALKPFADTAACWLPHVPDNTELDTVRWGEDEERDGGGIAEFTVGDLRRARAAYTGRE